MKWLEEIRATRRNLEEIGLLTVVREIFSNRFVSTPQAADETLGIGWYSIARRLAKAGLMELRITGTGLEGRIEMSVVAPGDQKRVRCKRLGKLLRTIKHFERDTIAKNTTHRKKKQ